MKRIGIVLDSINCNKYFYSAISELVQHSKVDIFFLIHKTGKENLWSKIYSKIRMSRCLSHSEANFVNGQLFNFFIYIEYKILSIFYKHIRHHFDVMSIEKFITTDNTIHLDYGKLSKDDDLDDINKIQSLGLDLIINGSLSDLRGNIINSAKDGVVSIVYSDNRWIRGRVPAFWEVYFRKDSTGFTVEIQREESHSNLVVFRGNIPTKRSYTENIIHLLSNSTSCLTDILLKYLIDSQLPEPEEKNIFGGLYSKSPSFFQIIFYSFRTSLLFFFLVIEKILHKQEKWEVAFAKAPWYGAVLQKGIRIKNPRGHFFADPFVITKNGRTVCYVEDYCYRRKKGSISAVEIINDKKYKILGSVIEESFHMSFPFLFEYDKELYMIPETSGASSIRLYKCIEFPLKWEFKKNILENKLAVDSMMFEYNDLWWLFYNVATTEKEDYCSILMACYSDSPLSDNWIEHKMNPLVFDSGVARNGGVLNVDDELTIRVRQKQGFNFYGKSITLAKIKSLTPLLFSEEEIGKVRPSFFKGINGCHHLHSNKNYIVYDCIKTEYDLLRRK